jgi:hypothetical protein
MRGSPLAAVLMPSLQNDRAMGLDHPANHIQLPGAEAVIASQPERLKQNLHVLSPRST